MADIFPGKAFLWGRIAVFLLCLACFCRGVDIQAAQAMLPASPDAPSMPLLPGLDCFIDETGTMDVEEAAAPENAAAFRPLALKELPRESGVTWLRFTLAPLPAGQHPATMLLDMGESVPGEPVLYEPVQNSLSGALEWRETSPAQRNVLLLPEAGKEALTCYIRLDGLPGLWFSPIVRTPQDAATNWDSLARTAAMLALGVVMLLCLLRGLSEKGQWRIWTALYVAVALAQGVIGMPAFGSGHVGPGDAFGVLAPGLALMLLPHVGRHLMHTRSRSRALDIQLLLLSLPGAALALLPLLPGFAWLIRYLNLWPLGALLFVPSALGAWIMGLGGAKRFLLGCLLPPLFVAAGILGLDSGYAANLMASAPLWGTALSALIIAATKTPRDAAENETDAATGKGARAPENAEAITEEDVLTLEQPLDDPNLRLIAAMPAAPSPHNRGESDLTPPSPASADRNAPSASASLPEFLEDALRLPLDRLLREGAALGHCALPPAVRQYAENMLDAAREMSKILSNPNLLHQEQGESEPRAPFNLQHLMREVHDFVAPDAESAGIGLAWYMPPHLGHMYEGEAHALRDTLCLLLESAVRATEHGAVHFSVRRAPESADAGHLLFTVTDTGSGMPPQNRSSLALTRAWELAGAHKGFLGVECTPHGTSIAFTLHLTYLEPDASAESGGEKSAQAHVIIAAQGATERQALLRMLEALPCRGSAARNVDEALELSATQPALLVVMQYPSHSTATVDALCRFQEDALAGGLPFCKALAITKDDSGWDALADVGFTHALLEPVESEAFCRTVQEILDEAALSVPAGPVPERPLSEPPPPAPESGAKEFESMSGADAFAPQAATMPSEKPETQAGRSPLPDLFGSESGGDSGASLKIPDLTALPDLLSFAESLRGPLESAPGPSRSRPQGGLSTDPPADAAPLPDIDLPLPSAFPDDLSAAPARLTSSQQEPGLQELTLPGLFANPHAPGDPVTGAALTPEKDTTGTGNAEPREPLPGTEEPTETAAAVQAEFSAVAGLEGPLWAAEDLQAQQSEAPGGRQEPQHGCEKPLPAAAEKKTQRETQTPSFAAAAEAAAPRTSGEAQTAAQAAAPEAAATSSVRPHDRPAAETAAHTASPAPAPDAAASAPAANTVAELAEPDAPQARASEATVESAAASPALPVTTESRKPSCAPTVAASPVPQPGTPPESAARAASARDYVGPGLAGPDEWVGEPMPIGSALPAVPPGSQASTSESAAQTAARKPLGFAARAANSGSRVACSVSPKAARPTAEGYISPSLSTPGEWVGEPVPVPPKNTPPESEPARREPRAASAKESGQERVGVGLSFKPANAQAVQGQLVSGAVGTQPSATRPETPGFETLSAPTEDASAAPETGQPGAAPISGAPPEPGAAASSFMDFIAGAAPAQGAGTGAGEALAASPSRDPIQPDSAPIPEPQPAAAEKPAALTPNDAGRSLCPSQERDDAILLLVERLDAALQDAQKGFQSRRGAVVGEAAGRIAAESESYGFRVLARMARCVERAAKANDLNALEDLLPELAVAVERNRIALTPRK
ncbi:HAMP domain-containing sensor histidine kinase [Desulfovibrio sp. ZJ200]|uniref:sensor histidine kinase n=1 Tax=Desulfovibrio sp. ZJ200 TaxID=2709792 RepID=UPI0013EADDFD|nr:HAMP domain-containing sensor histidine kinase [Desulfovibrio sp. ZJ200]